jgi:hypothetical protein
MANAAIITRRRYGLERLHRRMVKAIETVPMIHGVFVYDAAGNWLANSMSMGTVAPQQQRS